MRMRGADLLTVLAEQPKLLMSGARLLEPDVVLGTDLHDRPGLADHAVTLLLGAWPTAHAAACAGC
jgi:hypothetical protein